MPSTYDPQNAPKHCPECLKKGIKKKVKFFSINLDKEVVSEH